MRVPRRLTGRCLSGSESDGGRLYHAVEADDWFGRALCRAKPRRHSNGWSDYIGTEITCKRCLRLATASDKTKTGRSKSKHPQPTPERLREILDYNPDTGAFVWKSSLQGQSGRQNAGKPAGTLNKITGYIAMNVDGHRTGQHRVAWAYMTGKWPEKYVDHINGIKTDNRIANLREAEHWQNVASQPFERNSRFRGVRKTASGKWAVNIRINGNREYLGTFSKQDEASAAYEARSKGARGKFHFSGSRK